MELEIVNYGHPALRKKGLPVKRIDDELRELAQNMVETMHAANGVGLAAQQVAVPLQLCVLDVRDDPERPSRMWIDGKEVALDDFMPMIAINPQLKLIAPNDTGTEGCLSFPEIQGDITRPHEVEATITHLDGTKLTFRADGLLARALQHEVDHLNGILFIDRMKPRERAELKDELLYLKRTTERELKTRTA